MGSKTLNKDEFCIDCEKVLRHSCYSPESLYEWYQAKNHICGLKEPKTYKKDKVAIKYFLEMIKSIRKDGHYIEFGYSTENNLGVLTFPNGESIRCNNG